MSVAVDEPEDRSHPARRRLRHAPDEALGSATSAHGRLRLGPRGLCLGERSRHARVRCTAFRPHSRRKKRAQNLARSPDPACGGAHVDHRPGNRPVARGHGRHGNHARSQAVTRRSAPSAQERRCPEKAGRAGTLPRTLTRRSWPSWACRASARTARQARSSPASSARAGGSRRAACGSSSGRSRAFRPSPRRSRAA